MRTNRIRLTESQLHNVIKESVKRVLKEYQKEGRNKSSKEQEIEDSWSEFEKKKPSHRKEFDDSRGELFYGNINRYTGGSLGMDALENPNGIGRKLQGSSLNGGLKLKESIRRAIRKIIN